MKCEYTCCPKTNLVRSGVLVAALTLTCVLFGTVSVGKTVLSPIFSAASSVLLLLAAMLAVRFIGTRYVYKITFGALGDGELSVSELRGFYGKSSDVKSCRTVCRVGLFDVKEATVFERGDESRTKIKEMKKRIRRERAAVYNYLPDVFADKYALLRIENGDGISYLKLSPDGELMRIIGK